MNDTRFGRTRPVRLAPIECPEPECAGMVWLCQEQIGERSTAWLECGSCEARWSHSHRPIPYGMDAWDIE